MLGQLGHELLIDAAGIYFMTRTDIHQHKHLLLAEKIDALFSLIKTFAFAGYRRFDCGADNELCRTLTTRGMEVTAADDAALANAIIHFLFRDWYRCSRRTPWDAAI
jgi:hypothetical protein